MPTLFQTLRSDLGFLTRLRAEAIADLEFAEDFAYRSDIPELKAALAEIDDDINSIKSTLSGRQLPC